MNVLQGAALNSKQTNTAIKVTAQVISKTKALRVNAPGADDEHC
jgi:hypothetical protein